LSENRGAKVSLTRNASGKSQVSISLDEPHKLEPLIAKLES
jgi:ParB family chromosome partitioning protein